MITDNIKVYFTKFDSLPHNFQWHYTSVKSEEKAVRSVFGDSHSCHLQLIIKCNLSTSSYWNVILSVMSALISLKCFSFRHNLRAHGLEMNERTRRILINCFQSHKCQSVFMPHFVMFNSI